MIVFQSARNRMAGRNMLKSKIVVLTK